MRGLLFLCLLASCGPLESGLEIDASSCHPGCRLDRYDLFIDDGFPALYSEMPRISAPDGAVVRLEARCRGRHAECCYLLEECLRFGREGDCFEAWQACGLEGFYRRKDLAAIFDTRCVVPPPECAGSAVAPDVLVLKDVAAREKWFTMRTEEH